MVGRWGGQVTAKQMSLDLGIPLSRVRSYAQHWGLSFCKHGATPRYQVEVALRASTSVVGGPSTLFEEARAQQILPPELVYYRRAVPVFEALMLDKLKVTLKGLLEEYTLESVQDLWENSYALKAPWGTGDEEELRTSELLDSLC